MVPTVVSKLSAPASNNIAIAPSFQLTHYSLHIYNPKDHSLGERTSWKSGGNALYQGRNRNDIYYWITCCMDNTGVEFFISS